MSESKTDTAVSGAPGLQEGRRIGGFKTGKVIRSSMQKTVVVEVERLISDPLYGRTMRRSKRFLTHDESQQCRVGDVVSIRECRPLSKLKRWRVHSVIRKAAQGRVEVAALEKKLATEDKTP